MARRVFITGAMGYLGGQFLHDISRSHPELELVALVRDEAQAQKLNTQFPAVRTVLGDLSSNALLLHEAALADVVVQAANSDISSAVNALVQGLGKNPKTGAFIQISGAASILDVSQGFGKPVDRIWDDVTDAKEIAAFGEGHIHWETDRAVLEYGKKYGVRTCTVVSSWIYGMGEGPGKQQSSLGLPMLEAAIKSRGQGFTVGEGANLISAIHVKDLSAAMVLFVERALKPDESLPMWGEDGIYYVEDGREDYRMVDVVSKMTQNLKTKGLIGNLTMESLSEEEVTKINAYGPLIWGGNARCRATKLRSLGREAKHTLFGVLDEGGL